MANIYNGQGIRIFDSDNSEKFRSSSYYTHSNRLGGVQGAKLLGSRISETPKNCAGNPKFGPGFPTGNPEKMLWT